MLKTNIGNYAKEQTNKKRRGYWLAVEIREERSRKLEKNVKRERVREKN